MNEVAPLLEVFRSIFTKELFLKKDLIGKTVLEVLSPLPNELQAHSDLLRRIRIGKVKRTRSKTTIVLSAADLNDLFEASFLTHKLKAAFESLPFKNIELKIVIAR